MRFTLSFAVLSRQCDSWNTSELNEILNFVSSVVGGQTYNITIETQSSLGSETLFARVFKELDSNHESSAQQEE